VSEIAKVVGRDPSTQDIIDRHRTAIALSGPTVDEYDRDTAPHQMRQLWIAPTLDRGDQNSSHTLLLQEVEVASFPGNVLTAVAHHGHSAGSLDRFLGTADDVGKEGVRDIEHDDGDGTATARPKLAGGVVANVADFPDDLEHTLPSLCRDHFGAVQHIADRAERDAGQMSDLFDARVVHRSFFSVL
jgi:hypothetical protein